MEALDWESEDYGGEDFPGEFDPDFISPSAAIARRLFSRRRPGSGRPAPTVSSTVGQGPVAAVMNRLRQLEDRQKTTTTELAALQQRSSARQSSETFGPLATAAVGAFALGGTKDWFT